MKLRNLCPVVLATGVLFSGAPGDASVANVAIAPGGLTLSNPTITVVGRNPVELSVKTSVIDARGIGTGWFLSVAAYSPVGSSASNLVVTAGGAECLPNSACTLPVNESSYPVTVGSTGTRSEVFDAEPASGLGAQSVDIRVMLPSNAPAGLQLGFSVSAEP